MHSDQQRGLRNYICLIPASNPLAFHLAINYSFLSLKQPWHPSPLHPLPQCQITSTQFCPSAMESVSLSFYKQAYFHAVLCSHSAQNPLQPPFPHLNKASSQMSGPAQLYEHSSQRKAKYFFFFLSVNSLVTSLMKPSFKDPQHQKSRYL